MPNIWELASLIILSEDTKGSSLCIFDSVIKQVKEYSVITNNERDKARYKMRAYTPIDEDKSSLKAAWDITNQPYLDYARYNSNRLKDSHQLDIRIDKEFYFKKWVLNLYICLLQKLILILL
jgi:hypothetical protein